MPSVKTILSGIALGSVVANAAAIPEQQNPSSGKSGFSVGQVAKTRPPRNFAADYVKALNRHGGSVDKGLASLASSRPNSASSLDNPDPFASPASVLPEQESSSSPATSPTSSGSSSSSPPSSSESGSVPAKPRPSDIMYVAPVVVGDSTLNLNFDTGSGDLWVFPKNVTRSAKQKPYKPSSSAKILDGLHWLVAYADSSWALGNVYQDRVSVGDVVAEKQSVEVADLVSPDFISDDSSDGMVGLGFGTLNRVKPHKQKTFFENVKDSLDKPLFTASLKHKKAGSYDFGFIDRSKYEGEIHYVPVNSEKGRWGVKVDGIEKRGSSHGPSFDAIVDTGSSVMLLNHDLCRSYYDDVPGALFTGTSWSYPCDTQLPDLHFKFGDYAATIPGKTLEYGENDDGSCAAALQNSHGGLNVLGDTFLKSQFVVFEAGLSPRLGLAPQKND